MTTSRLAAPSAVVITPIRNTANHCRIFSGAVALSPIDTSPERVTEASRARFLAELLADCGDFESAHLFRLIAHEAECGV